MSCAHNQKMLCQLNILLNPLVFLYIYSILLNNTKTDGQLTSLVLNSWSFFNLFSKLSRCASDSEGNSNCRSWSTSTFPSLTTCRVFGGVEFKWFIFTSILIRWSSMASVFFKRSSNSSTQLHFTLSNVSSFDVGLVAVVAVDVELEFACIFSKKLL